jgi:hypothetical protein
MFTSNMAGFAVIVVLYASLGFLAAIGMVWVAKSLFQPRGEQIFFSAFLIPIAGFYLAFTAHFGDEAAWRSEIIAVAIFTVLGLVGIRIPLVVAAGYVLHGLWDGFHELAAAGLSMPPAEEITAVPLAYGYLCATLDITVAGYLFTRRHAFRAAWQGAAGTPPAREASR